MNIIGILGGSYNPIHNGHVEIAKAILDSGYVDELWLLVSPQNPLKQNKNLLDDKLRLEMAQMAVADIPGIKVSDFEYHLSRPSYMVNTLNQLKRIYTDTEFVLVIGADNWCCFKSWYQYESILRDYRIIIYPRKNYLIDADKLPNSVIYLETPLFPISSTQIRQLLSLGLSVDEWVNPQVAQVLYREYSLKYLE